MNEFKTQYALKTLELADIPQLVEAFQKANWPKPASLFTRYIEEQHQEQRRVWLAYQGQHCLGYVTLKWVSQYPPFAHQNIPEIMDLNVLPAYRRQGIGRALLRVAEDAAKSQGNKVGIGVGLYGGPDGGYGPAQRLYIQAGYVPDGLGVTYAYQPIDPGTMVCLDDELVFWLTKELK
ncbi:MAG: GNAT family N-acetyltransferase [Legionella sp.]|nr:GNAT family N-acetyltransferase [Legionella sp.]